MCRANVEYSNFNPISNKFHLKIKSFHLHFSIAKRTPKLPETLTLIYLPRINGNPLEINGSKIRPDSPSFISLHRARSMEDSDPSNIVYASADRVRLGEAVRFEIYTGSEKLIKGVFRREGADWDLESKFDVDAKKLGIDRGEIWVGGERGVLMREELENLNFRKRRGFCAKLEEILEEKEREGCDCYDCCEEEEEEDDDVEEMLREGEWEMLRMEEQESEEMESVKWAVEMGVWVMCVGVGYFVSKNLRRRRIFW